MHIAPKVMEEQVAKNLQDGIVSVDDQTVYTKSMAARGGVVKFKN